MWTDACLQVLSFATCTILLYFTLTHAYTFTYTTAQEEVELSILSESALREMLLDNLIIDSSLIRATTVIGQGTAAAAPVDFACRITCSLAY